jgi:hypothetical protein
VLYGVVFEIFSHLVSLISLCIPGAALSSFLEQSATTTNGCWPQKIMISRVVLQ